MGEEVKSHEEKHPFSLVGCGDRSGDVLSSLKYTEKGDFVCLGLDARWQPFRCSSGSVGYLRSPACPGGGLQGTVPVKSRCGGCRLGSRCPPGGAVATRPPSLLPRSGVAAVIQWSAASDGSALATHPSPGGPPGRHHRELPGPCLRGDPAEIYRSSALSLLSGIACSPWLPLWPLLRIRPSGS